MNALKSAALVVTLTTVGAAHAGYATGPVGSVLVGRNGAEVYVELLTSAYDSWPCTSTHPNGYRYALLLTWPGAREMLATILAAQASGKSLTIVGGAVCTVDASVENMNYVILRP